MRAGASVARSTPKIKPDRGSVGVSAVAVADASRALARAPIRIAFRMA
jgi:hypothetical protein